MKINIVVDKKLNPGQKANVSAIIMGQLGRDVPELYSDVILDISKTKHVGISINVVILDGGSGQLLKLIENAYKNDIMCVVFSTAGQSLSNNYNEYYETISKSNTENTKIIGVGLYGEDDIIRPLTKKFSLAK